MANIGSNGSDAAPGPPPIFIVLLFVRVHHESVRCDVVDRRDAVYSDCQQARYWRKGDLISDRDGVQCVCVLPYARRWIGLLPRIYSAYSGIHYARFYAHGDLPDTEPPRRAKGISGISIRGSSSSRTTWISRSTRSQHHRPVCRLATPLLSLFIYLSFSLSRFCADNERQNESFLSSRHRASIDGKIGEFSPPPPSYLSSLRQFEIKSARHCDEIWFAHELDMRMCIYASNGAQSSTSSSNKWMEIGCIPGEKQDPRINGSGISNVQKVTETNGCHFSSSRLLKRTKGQRSFQGLCLSGFSTREC